MWEKISTKGKRSARSEKYKCVRRVAWERRDIVVSEGLELRSKKRPTSERKLATMRGDLEWEETLRWDES